MNRKKLNPALFMFPIGIVELLAIAGVPICNMALPVASVAVFVAASVAVIVMSCTFRKNVTLIVGNIFVFLTALTLLAVAEVLCSDSIILLAIGWLLGLATGVGGIIKSVRNRKEYRFIISVVLNSLTVAIALIGAVAEFVAFRGFVILD